MNTSFLLRGIIIGFSIAAPVGPISVIIIRRVLAEGRLSGFTSGVGAATADVIYGSIAGFGLTFISSFLIGQQTWIRSIGGLFLCYIGIKAFLRGPAERAAPVKGNGLVGAYSSTFFLTLTNPITILSFTAVFAALGASDTSGDYGAAATLVLGVFTGSLLWSLFLVSVVGAFRARLDARVLGWVNKISGVVIAGFGVAALLSLL